MVLLLSVFPAAEVLAVGTLVKVAVAIGTPPTMTIPAAFVVVDRKEATPDVAKASEPVVLAYEVVLNIESESESEPDFDFKAVVVTESV